MKNSRAQNVKAFLPVRNGSVSVANFVRLCTLPEAETQSRDLKSVLWFQIRPFTPEGDSRFGNSLLCWPLLVRRQGHRDALPCHPLHFPARFRDVQCRGVGKAKSRVRIKPASARS